MGCVVRTIPECADIIGQDISTDTALLESRYLTDSGSFRKTAELRVVKPHFEKEKKAYLDEIGQALREGIFSLENAIYRVEPHLKSGICCLRDCQRLLWAERVRSGVPDVSGPSRQGTIIFMSQAGKLEAGYGFITGLRAELHWLCQRRMLHVLETSLQPQIAERYGFGSAGAGRLMEQFFRTVRISAYDPSGLSGEGPVRTEYLVRCPEASQRQPSGAWNSRPGRHLFSARTQDPRLWERPCGRLASSGRQSCTKPHSAWNSATGCPGSVSQM